MAKVRTAVSPATTYIRRHFCWAVHDRYAETIVHSSPQRRWCDVRSRTYYPTRTITDSRWPTPSAVMCVQFVGILSVPRGNLARRRWGPQASHYYSSSSLHECGFSGRSNSRATVKKCIVCFRGRSWRGERDPTILVRTQRVAVARRCPG